MNLFVYGALMYDEIWNRIVSGEFERITAELPGFRRLVVRGEEYPGAIEGDGIITGCVWLNVDHANIEKLDDFEGEYYERITASVFDAAGLSVDVSFYHFKKQYRYLLDERDWDVEYFEKTGIKKFISQYAGFKK